MIRKLLYALPPERENHACNVCFSPHIKHTTATFSDEKPTSFRLSTARRTRHFIDCSSCSYSYCPENYIDDVATLENEGNSSRPGCVARIGDGATPGREYFMAMNVVHMRKHGLEADVLVFGAGFSRDHELVRAERGVRSCHIADLKNFQSSPYFLPLGSKKKFDVVVACEVVEHFMHPRKEFARLLSFLKKDGILIVSTNIRNDADLSLSVYPYLGGHVSYYSGRSLTHIADMNDLYIDFRMPTGKEVLGTTKRYIYMTGSKQAYFAIENHYSVFSLPYSEYH